MKRPRLWIRRGPDCSEPEFKGVHQWEAMEGDIIADVYTTREEARAFVRGYDPAGFYCLHCDASAKAKELPLIWVCQFCGKRNDWPAEIKGRHRRLGERIPEHFR